MNEIPSRFLPVLTLLKSNYDFLITGSLSLYKFDYLNRLVNDLDIEVTDQDTFNRMKKHLNDNNFQYFRSKIDDVWVCVFYNKNRKIPDTEITKLDGFLWLDCSYAIQGKIQIINKIYESWYGWGFMYDFTFDRLKKHTSDVNHYMEKTARKKVMPKITLTIELTRCIDCVNCEKKTVRIGTDSFDWHETMDVFRCSRADKQIGDEKTIPSWCPLIIDQPLLSK